MKLRNTFVVNMLTLFVLASGTSYAGSDGLGEPAAGTVWTEPKTGMEFAWMPSGCFQMGSDEGGKDEQQEHKVCLKGFWMGRTEVTQAQYRQIMGNNPSSFAGSNNPVEQVGVEDAENFIEKMSSSSGTKVRLPTEAQWEYACRAGSASVKYCGKGLRAEHMAWYDGNSGDQTHPVAQLAANDWGLYDMSGNVWEWVADAYHDSYNGAPTDGSAWTRYGKKNWRVLRGGSWYNGASGGRAANRYGCDPASWYNHFGFRLARTLP